jgi:ribonucleoside-triphosphate reductase
LNNPFDSYYEEFIYKSRYSRWLDKEGRREDWSETVTRYMEFMDNHLKETLNFEMEDRLYHFLEESIHSLSSMPSMRALMTAGPALQRDNVAGFNCAYTVVEDPRDFDEVMYILMCGTGIGFSVEAKYVNKLPEVPEDLYESDTTIVVADSKRGWAKALRQLIVLLYAGEIPKWDTSKVRLAGERLKTFGGRASGPEPLEDLFKFVVRVFKTSRGRKLLPIECHDILCKIGEIVVVGGVRRSAMISLSDFTDVAMARAKSIFDVDSFVYLEKDETDPDRPIYTYSITYTNEGGTKTSGHYKMSGWDIQELHDRNKVGWWIVQPQRSLANNSAVYNERPSTGDFLKEWISIYDSRSGERGIFNRNASRERASSNGRREVDGWTFGTNPCSEIILRPHQFCNLTEVVARKGDTVETLSRKVEAATILGTIQSTLTNFSYLRKTWKKNTEEERLLGVSITGIMDCDILNGSSGLDSLALLLRELREVAIRTNKEIASLLGINQSVAITCVKPSGTVSQLVNSSSGIHSRFALNYIRRVRADNKDPLTKFLISCGFPHEPEALKPETTTVFEFPVEAPDGSITKDSRTAIEELEMWKCYQENWCEHKPSVTIDVKEDEWPSVGGWVYENFDILSGVSFLPNDDHSYKQAPYEQVSVEVIKELKAKMPSSIDWHELSLFEKEDNTSGSQTLACSGGSCEIVDLI